MDVNLVCPAGIDMGDWQEVWEDSMACYYYWNVKTNEVTWELPSVLALQVQNVEQLNNGYVKDHLFLTCYKCRAHRGACSLTMYRRTAFVYID